MRSRFLIRPDGDRSKFSLIVFKTLLAFSSLSSVNLTNIESGLETQIAYATCIKHFFVRPEATTFFAIYLAAYAADLSTLVGSLPEKAPPPCGAEPP